MVCQSVLKKREKKIARLCKGSMHVGTYSTDKMEIIPHCDFVTVPSVLVRLGCDDC